MTTSERRYQQAIRELGCIICLLFRGIYSPAEIHHILSGGRRIGEKYVLGLCQRHHRGGFNNSLCTSRHPYRQAFVTRYGAEEYLRQEANKRIPVAA